MNTTIYHIDKKFQLSPGQLIRVQRESFSKFGSQIQMNIVRHGLTMPSRGGPELLDNPSLRKLHPLALREYLAECARHRVGVELYSRLNVFYAAESLEIAQEIGQRMVLDPGITIYQATVEGDVFRHDMSWFDHDLSSISYEERVKWFCNYWRSEAGHARRSRPPLAELLLQGKITIGEKVGET